MLIKFNSHAFVASALLLFAIGQPTHAQVISRWTAGGANDAFYNNSNWNTGIPPVDGVGIFELVGLHEVDINADAELLRISLNGGDFLFTGGNTLQLTDPNISAVIGGGFEPLSLILRGPGTTMVAAGEVITSDFGTLAMDRAIFESDSILFNQGRLLFDGGFANLDANVRSFQNGTIEVPISNSGPVNFLQDLQHNGNEIFIAAGKRINIFGGYTGRGPINGTGVIHFRGQIDPGVNPNQFLFGFIPVEGDVVIESSANLTTRLNGEDIPGSDRLEVGGDLAIQLPTLSVAVTEGCEISPGDEYPIVEITGSRTGTFLGHPEGDVVRTFGDIDMRISYFGGDGNDIVLTAIDNGALLGDVDQNGLVDLLDAGPFVARITQGSFQAEADVNEDGLVDLLDVARFIDILTGGGS